METLAIIAYRQPITKTQIEYIRGTNSDSVVNSLLEKGLIEERGEAEVLGRPMLYGSSEVFLKEFGLASIADLPATPYALTPQERQQVDTDLNPKVANEAVKSEGVE